MADIPVQHSAVIVLAGGAALAIAAALTAAILSGIALVLAQRFGKKKGEVPE